MIRSSDGGSPQHRIRHASVVITHILTCVSFLVLPPFLSSALVNRRWSRGSLRASGLGSGYSGAGEAGAGNVEQWGCFQDCCPAWWSPWSLVISVLFHLFSAMIFTLFVLWLAIVKQPVSLCWSVCRVPKCRKAMMGLTMKVHTYGTLHSGTSYNAAGHEFSVNE